LDRALVDAVQEAPKLGKLRVRDVLQRRHLSARPTLDLVVQARLLSRVRHRERGHAPVVVAIADEVRTALGALTAHAVAGLAVVHVQLPTLLRGLLATRLR